jgi:hypothetical protein
MGGGVFDACDDVQLFLKEQLQKSIRDVHD